MEKKTSMQRFGLTLVSYFLNISPILLSLSLSHCFSLFLALLMSDSKMSSNRLIYYWSLLVNLSVIIGLVQALPPWPEIELPLIFQFAFILKFCLSFVYYQMKTNMICS